MMEVVFAVMILNGISFVAWGSVGACRFTHENVRRWLWRRRPDPERRERPARRVTPADIAVLVPAHNEEQSLASCLEAVSRLVPVGNIFVGSDGSSDRTVDIALEWGCNVLDIQPNRGKAGALKALIDQFEICDRYEAAMIVDADARPEPDYLERALPLLDDEQVAAVAGHALPAWWDHGSPRWSMLFAAYRTRLYRVTQAIFRYPQTWRYANVSFIIPGFSSVYRCSALRHIDVAAPGLIIEDFNMTFEVHHKKLGRIAYSPRARSATHEPLSFGDYTRQVRRWYLGFWQTVRRHGVWPSFFWLALGLYAVEMILQSVVLLTVPVVLAWFVLQAGDPMTMWLPPIGIVDIAPIDVLVGVFAADYALTLVVAAYERRPILALYGVAFILLRLVDSFLFLSTLPLAFVTSSDGRWVSPARA